MSESAKVVAALQKQHGAKIGGLGAKLVDAPRIPTGIFQLDLATGGGFPEGLVSEVYGPEGSGKTTVAHLACAEVQRRGQVAVFVAIEPYDGVWAKKLGVDVDKMIVMVPDSAEQTVDVVQAMLSAEDVGIVCVDSLAQMIPMKELEEDAERVQVGGNSLIVGKMIRKVVVTLNQEEKRGHRPALILINQTRVKIGQMFGDPETTPGGNAYRFACALRLRIYGKPKMDKTVHASLPAYRETSGVIKKYKIPVSAVNFTYDLAVVPQKGLRVGEAESWTTVSNWLKKFGLLTNANKVWKCMGTEYAKLADIEHVYRTKPEVKLALQKEVTSRMELMVDDPETPDVE